MSRNRTELRPTTIESYPTAAAGSVMITQGATRVLCTASISDSPPPWLEKDEQGNFVRGWVTAEYAMLPGATPDRSRRGPNSRATEIQRLIGRSLRASVDLSMMPGLLITCDCDVIYADGGTRCASITGGSVALHRALTEAVARGLIPSHPMAGHVTAISVGIVEGEPQLDLDYALDSTAEVDMNVVMNHGDAFVELQGTAEGAPFDQSQLDQLLALARSGVTKLRETQQVATRT